MTAWNDYYQQARQNAVAGRNLVEGCIAAGRMLIELKKTTPRGEWGKRLAAGPVPARTARAWMRAARQAETATVAISEMTLRELLGMPRGRKPPRSTRFKVPTYKFWDCDEQHWLPEYREWAMHRPAWIPDRKRALASEYRAELERRRETAA